MPTSPNPLLWSFYRQIGAGEETGGMVHHSDAHSTDLFLNAGVRDQNANVPYGNWEDASWGQVQEFYPVEYANFEVDQPFSDNVYATGVFLNDPTNELYLHHYRYDRENTQLEEISKSRVSYKPVVPRPPKDERLRFVAEEAGSTITLQIVGTLTTVPVLEYSLDAGETWTEFSCNNAPVITLANVGDTVWMRGENTNFASSTNVYTKFVMTGKIAAKGSIEYLRSKSGAATNLSIYCYSGMFRGCTSLTEAPELPATTLENSCYAFMFYGCTSLTTAPELPATTLVSSCYYHMFYGCTSLTEAPELNAIDAVWRCYGYMFYNCTSLVVAPNLPAKKLGLECYNAMFQGCISLTTPPELPAETLDYQCYMDMFRGCTSLTEAPELPAKNLATGCYREMFYRCSSLTTAPELPATTLSLRNAVYYSMFYGCTSLTTPPDLPAVELSLNCYTGMFGNCTSLVTAPDLPAETISQGGYLEMFYGCTSLTEAPKISAKNLILGCCRGMFQGCTSLRTAPELHATTLVEECYGNMFYGCTSLNYIRVAFDIWNPTSATLRWMSGVSPTGTFVCPEGLPQTMSVSRIPPGWTVETF